MIPELARDFTVYAVDLPGHGYSDIPEGPYDADFFVRYHFASWTGTAPIDASSGEQIRHRLSRAGNRRLNHVLYMAGNVQMRHDTEVGPTTAASSPKPSRMGP